MDKYLLMRVERNLSRHPEIRSSFRRRSSAFDFPQTNTRRSSLAFRKNDQVNVDNARRLSLLELKANGEASKNMKNLVVKVRSSFHPSGHTSTFSTIKLMNLSPLIY